MKQVTIIIIMLLCAFTMSAQVKNGAPQKTIKYQNGDSYVGQTRNNQRHGEGIYYWTEGDKYDGEWTNDKENGIGAKTFANGDFYV